MTDDRCGLASRIRQVTSIDPDAGAIEYGGLWYTWGEVRSTVDRVAEQIPGPGAPVGVVLRNRPAQVAIVLGVLAAGSCVVAIDPERAIARPRDHVSDLGLALVAGEQSDVCILRGSEGAATATGWEGLGTRMLIEPAGGPEGWEPRPGVAVRMLTSGTTGAPKRVDLTYSTLERVLADAKHYETNTDVTVRLRTGVAVVNSPLVHLGGLFRVLQCVNDGRAFALLERFTVDRWVEAVRRHKPRTASLVPAALRMVLEADVDPSDLESLRSVVSGTAPLDPDDADAFRARFGVPVLISYAATEFGGGVAGWNLSDHREFWASKRGSVGRAHPGCKLRVVEPGTDEVLGIDEEGLLEVQARQLGDDGPWLRTTDIARIDAEGFVWILGRADQAIIRGGFKIRPEDVRTAIESHPAVRGAAVVSMRDARLGEVPVAAVELRAAAKVTEQDIRAHIATRLARYELPTSISIVPRLPRTPVGKVDLAAVRRALDESATEID